MTGSITTHVLDTSIGRPAAGLHVTLEFRSDAATWRNLSAGVTDAGGRIGDLVPNGANLVQGIYRLTFDTRSYFVNKGLETFYPSVVVMFELRDTATHYHVPLLLSPFGYSTYRGS